MKLTKIVIGETVTIRILYNSPLLPSWYPDIPNFKEYTGVVLPSGPLDDVDSVRITSDNPDVEVRVIGLHMIIGWNGGPFTYRPVAKKDVVAETKYVKVPGSKGNEYTITILPDGRKKCSCSGFGFRNKCKHVDAYTG